MVVRDSEPILFNSLEVICLRCDMPLQFFGHRYVLPDGKVEIQIDTIRCVKGHGECSVRIFITDFKGNDEISENDFNKKLKSEVEKTRKLQGVII